MKLERTFTQSFDVNQLHDHIINTVDPDDKTIIRMESRGNTVYLQYPDELDAIVKDALRTYVYTPKTPTKSFEDRLADLDARLKLLESLL